MSHFYDDGKAIARQSPDDAPGLGRIEESTATINQGMRNPFVYLVFIVSLVLIPFTGGLSFGGGGICLLLMTRGGKAAVQAAAPTAADLAAPGLGCIRIVASGAFLVLIVVTVALFGLIVWANATGNMR